MNMRKIISIVEQSTKLLSESLVSQSFFTDEDAIDNIELTREDVKNNNDLWQQIAVYGNTTIIKRSKPVSGSVWFAALIKADGQSMLVGCCDCDVINEQPFGEGLTVDNVAVLPDHRKTGIAISMYKAIIGDGNILYAGSQTPGGAAIWAAIIKNNIFRVCSIDDDGNVEEIVDPVKYIQMRKAWPDPYSYVMRK